MPAWLWWIVAICCLEVIAVKVFLMVRKTRQDVTTTLVRSAVVKSGKRTLFVHLPGFGGDGIRQIQNILRALLAYGDVLGVHYDGTYGSKANSFSAELVVTRVFLELQIRLRAEQYDNIVFFGTSMGGKLSYVIAQRMAMEGFDSTKAALVDPPLRWRDLQWVQRILAPFIVVLLYIPFLNLFLVVPALERVLAKLTFGYPKESETDSDLTDDERPVLKRSVEMAQAASATYCRDQVIAMLRRTPRSLRSLPSPWSKQDVVLVRSMNDGDVVRESAARSWAALLNVKGIKQYKIPGAKHAAYGQNPGVYRRRAIPKVTEHLDLQ